jgi:hypothetical protein
MKIARLLALAIDMTPYTQRQPNVLVTKAPILIEGHDAVTLAVPPAPTSRAPSGRAGYASRDVSRFT